MYKTASRLFCPFQLLSLWRRLWICSSCKYSTNVVRPWYRRHKQCHCNSFFPLLISLIPLNTERMITASCSSFNWYTIKEFRHLHFLYALNVIYKYSQVNTKRCLKKCAENRCERIIHSRKKCLLCYLHKNRTEMRNKLIKYSHFDRWFYNIKNTQYGST